MEDASNCLHMMDHYNTVVNISHPCVVKHHFINKNIQTFIPEDLFDTLYSSPTNKWDFLPL